MNLFTILKRILFWSYDRGTWQYDVAVVAILAFIFLVPAGVFDDAEARPRRSGLGPARERFVSAEQAGNGSIQALSTALDGAEVERVEIERGRDGRVLGYRVWGRSRVRSGE